MPPPDREEVLDYLADFLAQTSPRLLLITGSPGTGKSSLLVTLERRVRGPKIFIAYRISPTARPGEPLPDEGEHTTSLLLVDPDRARPATPEPPGAAAPPGDAAGGAASGMGASLPAPIRDAVARIVGQGGGSVFVDSWDRSSEATFSRSLPAGTPVEMSGLTRQMREAVNRFPLHVVVALAGIPDAGMESLADAIVELKQESVDGCRLRIGSVRKVRWHPLGEPSFLFTLSGGTFRSFPRLTRAFTIPVGPPSPDPVPGEPTLWPGSADFAGAFGRLRHHALTGFEMSPLLPFRLVEVFGVPAAAHVLRSGGRVLWIPSPQAPPSSICHELLRSVNHDWLRERLRMLSAAGPDRTLGDLQSVILPVRRTVGEGGELRTATAAPVGPAFPEGYRFLRDGTPETPALFVLSLDGLRALASVSGVSYPTAQFPLILSAYLKLPRFHGLGFGRSDDPLTQASLPSVETHLKVREHLGRVVVSGVRPETPGYVLDWSDPDGRYDLLRID